MVTQESVLSPSQISTEYSSRFPTLTLLLGCKPPRATANLSLAHTIEALCKIMIWYSGSIIQISIAVSGNWPSICLVSGVSLFYKKAIIRNRSLGYPRVNLESRFHTITSLKSRPSQIICRLITTVTIKANKENQYAGILLAVEIWGKTFSLYRTLLVKSCTFLIKYILKIKRTDASLIFIHYQTTTSLKKALILFLAKRSFATTIQSMIYQAIRLASMCQPGL